MILLTVKTMKEKGLEIEQSSPWCHGLARNTASFTKSTVHTRKKLCRQEHDYDTNLRYSLHSSVAESGTAAIAFKT